MKKAIILLALCIFSNTAFSHPGKTDKYGGHKCVKGCEEWGLYYAEYHLHDKDWKPIRINKKAAKMFDHAELQTAVTETLQPTLSDAITTTQTVTVYRYVTTIKKEEVLPFNPLLWILLVLLLLLLILRLNRKRSAAKIPASKNERFHI
jgi:hypothetical protein